MSEKDQIYEIIMKTLIEKGAEYVAIFGSFARNEETKDSDIDVLVSFKEPISLFDHAGIVMEIEEKIGKKVDLVTKKGMSKFMSPFIMKDLVTLYEAR